ncbi:hypothetical protein VNO77_27804 [Canavalia gladiata]|uniref:Uncharacterized protein n=1 Tax=Canavalia gladiata TaxID=3824 RepID=A0AAN9Q6U2_CANGL
MDSCKREKVSYVALLGGDDEVKSSSYGFSGICEASFAFRNRFGVRELPTPEKTLAHFELWRMRTTYVRIEYVQGPLIPTPITLGLNTLGSYGLYVGPALKNPRWEVHRPTEESYCGSLNFACTGRGLARRRDTIILALDAEEDSWVATILLADRSSCKWVYAPSVSQDQVRRDISHKMEFGLSGCTHSRANVGSLFRWATLTWISPEHYIIFAGPFSTNPEGQFSCRVS